MPSMLRSLWNYRGFILGSVQREFQSKYRHSLLGAAWTVIQPLAMILVYTVIFSQVMRAKLPNVDTTFGYGIHLCAGLLTWGLFTEIVGKGQNIFIENANLLKKISFPRMTLPLIMVLNACVNFTIIFGLFLLFLMFSGNWPGWIMLAIVPLLFIQLLFSIGLGMVLGVLNVFFRDVGHFFGIFIQFWFWLTPIVYPVDILPTQARILLSLNPMMPLIAGYQGILVQGRVPDWFSTLVPAILGVLLCVLGSRLFRRHVGDMVDEL